MLPFSHHDLPNQTSPFFFGTLTDAVIFFSCLFWAQMEDRYFVSEDLTFFAVYDGHGGYRVADMALAHMFDFFVQAAGKSPAEKLRDAVHKVSSLVLSDVRLDMEGSTAVIVHIGDTKYTSANVGDSRAILCRGSDAVNLTADHKPDSPSERSRVEKLGGVVKWHGYLGPDRLPVQVGGVHMHLFRYMQLSTYIQCPRI